MQGCHLVLYLIKQKIIWWVENIASSFSCMKSTLKIDYIIYTDASNLGWEASDWKNTINGRWPQMSKVCTLIVSKHLLFPLSYTYKEIYCLTMWLQSPILNKQGGIQSVMCNDIAVDIWRNVLGRAYMSQQHTFQVYIMFWQIKASRNFEDTSEWMLSTSVFLFLTYIHGTPETDLLVTRLN